MQNKVTSYSISQRLAELGFEAESHNGWWRGLVFNYQTQLQKWEYCRDEPTEYTQLVKAYDCHDLLMWFKTNHTPTWITVFSFGLRIDLSEAVAVEPTDEPTNALGLAVIKILEKGENK